MDYKLNFNNKKISVLTLGLMTNLNSSNESDYLKLYKKAYELGINSFDTAPNYNNGYSDIFLGKLINEIGRKNIHVSTKIYYKNKYSPEKSSLNKTHLVNSLEGSMNSLKTDYIDTLFLHKYDNEANFEDVLEFISESLSKNKIKSWGICSFKISNLKYIFELSEKLNIQKPKFAQYAYNLFNRNIEENICDYTQRKDIYIFSYYPLSQGIITGKYSRVNTFSRANNPELKKKMWDLNENNIKVVKKYIQLCSKINKDPVGLAYNWCLQNRSIFSLLTNVRNESQLYHNIESLKSNLNNDINVYLSKIFSERINNKYIL